MASLRRRRSAPSLERNGFDDLQSWIQLAGAQFPVTTSGLLGAESLPDATVAAFTQIYKTNGIVSACMAVRQRIFSEVTFRFAEINNGKTGRMFGTPALGILEHPWPNGTTGELATRMIQDVDLAGNFFAVRQGDRLYRRDPAKTSIILSGDPAEDEFVDVLGYAYQPKGKQGPTYTYEPHEMCHWSPEPDPEHPYKGMSWITPILREIRADNAATDHKAKFFTNGATPNMIVKFPEGIITQEQFDRFKAKMESDYAGSTKAHKTMYLAPGADVEVVGAQFKEMDFAETQGRDETRIASRAGVPPVIVGLKESLAGSSLNQGNYAAARRSLADITMRPLYRSAAAALETVVPPPQTKGASKLWYDDSGVAFFREDRADAATIQSTQAQTIKAYIDAGFEPVSVVAAVEAEDRSLLVHSGLYSVQLQAPGTSTAPDPAVAQKRDEDRSREFIAALAATRSDPTVINLPATPVTVEHHAHVETPEVRVDNHFTAPDVHVDVAAPEVRMDVPAAQPPIINVAPSAATVHVDATVVNVDVQPADVTVLPTEPKTRRVERNSKGEIVKVHEE